MMLLVVLANLSDQTRIIRALVSRYVETGEDALVLPVLDDVDVDCDDRVFESG